MKLYFDVGNTSIKLNLIDKKLNNYVSYKTYFPFTIDLLWNMLPKEVKSGNVTKVSICSVVPTLTPMIKGLIKKYFQVKPLVISWSQKCGIQWKIDNPKLIGADLVALGAFSNLQGKDVVMVNMGTTTTIIHVKNSFFLGAIIMPSIKIQKEAIIKKTAKIGNVHINYSSNILGKNTTEALSLGIVNSHIYAIKEHIKTFAPNAKVFISGNNAKTIKGYVDYKYVKEATIEGMKIIESLN